MPKVSVIIPIYNITEYLHTSVTSAIEQTERDIEIILVDDGSADGSSEKCDRYAETDARIRVVHKKNGGLSSARNAGTAVAEGEYVLFLDGDDYLHPRAVERLLEAMAAEPAEIVQFLYTEVAEKTPLPQLQELAVEARATSAEEAFVRLYEKGGVYASGCTKLFSRELALRIPFEPIRHEDEMWCTRAFPRNLRITYIPDVLYGYIMREGSIIRGGFNKNRLEVLTVKEERIAALQELGLLELENKERQALFTTLFILYRDAKADKSSEGQRAVIKYFKANKIGKIKVCGKWRLFSLLAKINTRLAFDIYALYWSIKK